MCLLGANGKPWAGLSNGPIPDPTRPLTPQTGVEKSPFQISANRVEVDENVNGAHLGIHWLVAMNNFT